MEGDYEMNKQEAIRLARKGIKVRHMYFSPEEWMYINPMGEYALEDGVVCDAKEWWTWRQDTMYETGWSVFNPHLRLVVTEKCPNNCEGCCMKNWKFDPAIPMELDDLRYFSEIYITGGEPMEVSLFDMGTFLVKIKEINPNIKLFLYTATAMRKRNVDNFKHLMSIFDGASITIHSDKDMYEWNKSFLGLEEFKGKSMRLNVFGGLEKDKVFMINTDYWDVRPKVWITDCPLPKQEEFGKLILL